MSIQETAIQLGMQIATDPFVQESARKMGTQLVHQGTSYCVKQISAEAAKLAIPTTSKALGAAAIAFLATPVGMACAGIVVVGGIAYAIDRRDANLSPEDRFIRDSKDQDDPMVRFSPGWEAY